MNHEMPDLEMDRSIGGVSQGQQSKKSNKSGNVRNGRKKPLDGGGENSAAMKLQTDYKLPKSPDIVRNERKLESGNMTAGIKRM